MLEEIPEQLYKFELMTPTHALEFPAFDATWSWAGASVLLKTSQHLILIKRSLTMPTHAGQMAFIGGYRKPHETHPFEVILREFGEETGLGAEVLGPQGLLRPVRTARSQPIVPVVAELLMPVQEFLTSAASNGEWDELIAVPWDQLNQPHRWSWGVFNGHTPHPVLMTPIAAGRYLQHRGDSSRTHILWGATARMVWDYLALYYRPTAGL